VGGLARYDASSIGRVISNERVQHGNIVFGTCFDSWSSESYDYVAEL